MNVEQSDVLVYSRIIDPSNNGSDRAKQGLKVLIRDNKNIMWNDGLRIEMLIRNNLQYDNASLNEFWYK